MDRMTRCTAVKTGFASARQFELQSRPWCKKGWQQRWNWSCNHSWMHNIHTAPCGGFDCKQTKLIYTNQEMKKLSELKWIWRIRSWVFIKNWLWKIIKGMQVWIMPYENIIWCRQWVHRLHQLIRQWVLIK